MTAVPPVVIAAHTIEGVEFRSGVSGPGITTPDVLVRVEFSYGDASAALRSLGIAVAKVQDQIALTEQARP